MMLKIKNWLFGNRRMDRLSVPFGDTREELRKSMLDEVRNTGDRIIAKGRFNNSVEVKHLQEEVMSIANDVLLGHATFEEFKAFCRRWEHKATL